MSFLKPRFKVSIGPSTFEPGGLELIDLEVSVSMDSYLDQVKATFTHTPKTLRLRRGDEISVELGYEKGLKKVFKGVVKEVHVGTSKVKVVGYNDSHKLLELRVDQTYEGQSAGSIVSDLASRAGVSVEEVMDGLSFSQYVVDKRKSAYHHIRDLALKCGFDAYFNPNGELVFKRYEEKDVHEAHYGKNLIDVEVYEVEPLISGVVVYGESPASFKGADTSHWLAKREVEGSSGSGIKLSVYDPTVKDKDSAEKVAEALLRELVRAVKGYVKIVGRSEVKLGDTVEIKGVPYDAANGKYQVRTVEHVFNVDEGFTTSIHWRRKSE
ncbi:MAG: hypothetical protein DRJ62_04590 [Thermoprotei archaeon]|nr:MAG: hypothetical protein DRJ62_04590 [Thermoprotei archaeon]